MMRRSGLLAGLILSLRNGLRAHRPSLLKVLEGFTLASSWIIVASQLPVILGAHGHGHGFQRTLWLLTHPASWHLGAALMSVATIAILQGGRRLHPLTPGAFIAAAIGIAASLAGLDVGPTVGAAEAFQEAAARQSHLYGFPSPASHARAPRTHPHTRAAATRSNVYSVPSPASHSRLNNIIRTQVSSRRACPRSSTSRRFPGTPSPPCSSPRCAWPSLASSRARPSLAASPRRTGRAGAATGRL